MFKKEVSLGSFKMFVQKWAALLLVIAKKLALVQLPINREPVGCSSAMFVGSLCNEQVDLNALVWKTARDTLLRKMVLFLLYTHRGEGAGRNVQKVWKGDIIQIIDSASFSRTGQIFRDLSHY